MQSASQPEKRAWEERDVETAHGQDRARTPMFLSWGVRTPVSVPVLSVSYFRVRLFLVLKTSKSVLSRP